MDPQRSESFLSESLILAQSERWRRGSDMQVERDSWVPILRVKHRDESGERVSNT